MTALMWTLAVALVLVGLIGVIVPALPGTVLVFAGLLLAAWADGFARVGAWTLVLIGVIGAASYTVDFGAAALGAQRLGASRRAMAGAPLGTVAGLFFGLPGLILGPCFLSCHVPLRERETWGIIGASGGPANMAKTGRNELCPCGSGRKYKKCCEAKERAGTVRNRMMLIAVGGALIAALVAALASFTTEPAGPTRVWSAEHGHYHDANGVAVP